MITVHVALRQPLTNGITLGHKQISGNKSMELASTVRIIRMFLHYSHVRIKVHYSIIREISLCCTEIQRSKKQVALPGDVCEDEFIMRKAMSNAAWRKRVRMMKKVKRYSD